MLQAVKTGFQRDPGCEGFGRQAPSSRELQIDIAFVNKVVELFRLNQKPFRLVIDNKGRKTQF